MEEQTPENYQYLCQLYNHQKQQMQNQLFQEHYRETQMPSIIPEEPICKRLPKRKCVIDLEKIKSSHIEPDMSTLEEIKKPIVRTGCSGRRRGRPPSKPRACNYVFSTNFINVCSMLIANGLTNLSIIDLHKKFFKAYTPLSPETLSKALMSLEQYKVSLTSGQVQEQPIVQTPRNGINNAPIQPYVQNTYNVNYARYPNAAQNQYMANYSTGGQSYLDPRYQVSYPQNYLVQMPQNMVSNNTNTLQNQPNQSIQYQNIRSATPMVYNLNSVAQTSTYLQEQTQRLAGRSLQDAYNNPSLYIKHPYNDVQSNR